MRVLALIFVVMALVWAPEQAHAQRGIVHKPPEGPQLTGAWTGTIDWDDGGPDTHGVSWTFTPDGAFTTADGYAGIWSQYGDRAIWVFTIPPNSVYEMQFISPDVMAGQMHNRDGTAGTVNLQRVQQDLEPTERLN